MSSVQKLSEFLTRTRALHNHVTKCSFLIAKGSFNDWSRRGGVHTNPKGTDYMQPQVA